MLFAVSAGARKVKTVRSGAVGRSDTGSSPVIAAMADTVIPGADDIRLSGYDKPLRSSRESVFISNLTGYEIISFVLTTVYFDMQDRQLHQSSNRINMTVPAGETRLATYPSWDRQRSFYFHGSSEPRSSAIPYDIRQRVDTLFVTPLNPAGNAPSY